MKYSREKIDTKDKFPNAIGNCVIDNKNSTSMHLNSVIGNSETKNMLALNYRTILMFFIFSFLFLSFNVMGVFAGPYVGDVDDGSSDSAWELLETQQYIVNNGQFFRNNVHWVPTKSNNGM